MSPRRLEDTNSASLQVEEAPGALETRSCELAGGRGRAVF